MRTTFKALNPGACNGAVGMKAALSVHPHPTIATEHVHEAELDPALLRALMGM